MKKATLCALLAIAMIAFGCKKDDPTDKNPEVNPLKVNTFSLCNGSSVGNGTVQWTLYNSFEDWKAGAGAFASGSDKIPVEIYVPDLKDGQKYYYDIMINDEDNWFGGNVLAKSQANFSFTYKADGNNTLAPKLYSGRKDLLGNFVLSDVRSNGTSLWASVEDCLKDNFLTVSKDFTMLVSEGSDVCTGVNDETFQFYYTNCVTGDPDQLAEFESDWLGEAGHEAIVFDIESGKSRLTLTRTENGAPVEYVYVRN